jgi:peptide/nickel transport system permease protein
MASKKVETISSQDQAGISQGQLIRRRFLKHRGAMIGLVVLIFVIVISFSSVGTVVGGTGKLIVDASGSSEERQHLLCSRLH